MECHPCNFNPLGCCNRIIYITSPFKSIRTLKLLKLITLSNNLEQIPQHTHLIPASFALQVRIQFLSFRFISFCSSFSKSLFLGFEDLVGSCLGSFFVDTGVDELHVSVSFLDPLCGW